MPEWLFMFGIGVAFGVMLTAAVGWVLSLPPSPGRPCPQPDDPEAGPPDEVDELYRKFGTASPVERARHRPIPKADRPDPADDRRTMFDPR